jgi:hypothetical protein
MKEVSLEQTISRSDKLNRSPILENNIVCVLIIISVSCLLRLLFSQGFVGSDDSAIINPALAVLKTGLYIPTSHYDARLGLVLPLSLMYGVFGTGLLQTMILPILYSVGLALLVFLSCRKIEMSGGYSLLAAMIPAVMPIGVLFGASNYPEVPFAFFAALAIYVMTCLITSEHTKLKEAKLLALLFLALFVLHLIKIEVIFVAMAFGFGFLILKRFKLFLIMVVFTFGLFIVEDILIYSYDGFELFSRLNMVTGNSVKMSVNADFSHTQPWIFAKSMFVTFYNFGLFFYFTVAALIWTVIRWKKIHPVVLLCAISTIFFFIWLQFGMTPKNLIHFLTTGELKNKSQLPRYLFMLVPFAAIVVAYWLQNMQWQAFKLKGLALLALVGSMLAFIPLNEISYEHIKAYQQAPAKLQGLQIKTVYADRATFSYFESIQQLGEIADMTIKPLVHHNIHKGITRPNQELLEKGGYILVNKNRYLYHNRRYNVNYPRIESLNSLGEPKVLVSNPSSFASYAILNTISWGVTTVLGENNALSEKVLGTVNESLDSEDLVLYYVSPENAKKLEYMQ